MKITNHYPMREWYDNNNYTHIDYPPLAAYAHYYMAGIYRHYDGERFDTDPRFGADGRTPGLKLGMRRTILLTNLLTYFPVVIYVVMQNLKAYSRLFRMSTIFIFLIFPAYAFIEFTNTQVNGPHLALLLLSIHSLFCNKLLKATFFFTLSVCYKQVLGPFVFPTGIFILAKEWSNLSSYKGSKRYFWLAYRAILHGVVGVITLAVVCAPLLLDPPGFKNMMGVITHINFRGFLNPCPSVWNIFKDIVGRDYFEVRFLPYIPFIFYFFAGVALIMAPFIFKKPTKDMFCAAFNIFGLTVYHFGFSIHEKHIHYMLMTFTLNPWEYRRFYAMTYLLSAWSMLPTACFERNDALLWKYGTGFLFFIILYERLILNKSMISVAASKSISSEDSKPGFILTALNSIVKYEKRILAGAFLSMLTVIIPYIATTNKTLYYCYYDSFYEDTSVKVIFVWMMFIYAYSWLIFLKIFYYGSDEENLAAIAKA